MISPTRKLLLAGLLFSVCVSSSAQALTTEGLKKFHGISNKVAVVQNVVYAAIAGAVRTNSGCRNEDMLGLGALANLLTQFPDDFVASALEADRAWSKEISSQAMMFIGFGSELTELMAIIAISHIIDTAIFNKVNQKIHEKYPDAADETKRRAMRLACMNAARLAIMSVLHILATTAFDHDTTDRSISDASLAHTLINGIGVIFAGEHLVNELAGASISFFVNDAIAQDTAPAPVTTVAA